MKIDKDIKNQLVVMLDTSQEETIRIGKTDATPPQTDEELRDIVLLDIATLAEALVVCIRGAHQMGVKNEADSIRDVIQHITDGFVDAKMEVETRFPEGK
jgi:hypothetical protein